MKSIVSIVDLAKRIPLLSKLSDREIADISVHLRKVRYEKGYVLVRQGYISSHVSFILTGRAKVISRDKRGRDFLMHRLSIGEPVDVISAIDGVPNSATVIAETRMDMLTVEKSSFLYYMKSNRCLTEAIMHRMIERLRWQEQRISSLALMSVRDRVCETLLEMAEKVEGTQCEWVDYISKTDLSRMVGASREMVSRVMNELEREEYLSIDSMRRYVLGQKLLAIRE